MNNVSLKGLEIIKTIPNPVLEHPGMISRQERQLLYTLAYKYFSGRGCIVDAGAFLGASTMAFYHGLVDRGYEARSEKIIQSFERAIVGANFERHAKKAGLPVPDVGKTFENILTELITPAFGITHLHIGDILEFEGSSIDRIEIAFLDILKTPQVSRHCFQIFFPKLTIGSYVIQQDYFFDQLPFIKYTNETFSEYLEYKGEVRSSAVFLVKKPIPRSVVSERLYGLTDDEKLCLHAQAEGRAESRARQYLMKLSRVRLLAELGRSKEAKKMWSQADKDYKEVIFDGDSKNVKDNIQWRHNSLEEVLKKFEN